MMEKEGGRSGDRCVLIIQEHETIGGHASFLSRHEIVTMIDHTLSHKANPRKH